MKKILLLTLLIVADLQIFTPAIKAQSNETQTQYILLLGKKPKSDKDLTPEGLYDLLTAESKEWVAKVEAGNVNYNLNNGGYCGLWMNYNNNGSADSYVKITFKQEKLMNAYAVHTYATTQTMQNYSPLQIYLNDEQTEYALNKNNQPLSNIGNFDNLINYGGEVNKNTELMRVFLTEKNAPGFNVQYGTAIDPVKPLKSIKVFLPKGKSTTIDQLYGFKVLYRGTTQNQGTAVEEIPTSDDTPTVYYDLMGNRLQNAPTKGMFIEVKGRKVRKIIR